jgi:SAM-dependent methyltransferase
MKIRDARTTVEINNHMIKAKAAVNRDVNGVALPFAIDEYICHICNVYFRKKIFQSDYEVIEDCAKWLGQIGKVNDSLVLTDILESTNNLKNNIDGLHLKYDFHPILEDELKNKLRSLHKTKPTKDSRVLDLKGDEFDDFYAKYSRDLDFNWMRNVQRFVGLNLKKPSRILDIGCGFGFFSHIASFNGHNVDSLDIPNASPILKAATKLLKIKKHEFTIKKKTPLLKFKYKFDSITAFQIVFNGHITKDLWDVEEWKYFLMDLHDNLLNDGGSVTLVFNAEHNNFKPIVIDGQNIFLGKKSLSEFFNPFFIVLPGMAASDNKSVAVMTRKNIKDACQSNIFKKRSYSIQPTVGKYGA